MVYHLLRVLFGLAALTSLVAAGYLYFRPAPADDKPGLVVEEPRRVLKGLVVGRSYEVGFRIQNRTGHTRRVVGAELT